MKKGLILLAACFAVLCLRADNGDIPGYCPLQEGMHWTYSFYSKKEAKQKDDIHTYATKKEAYNGATYQLYEVPSRNMRYFTYVDATGVYLKAAKVKLPVFRFIELEMVFKPEVQLMRYPVVPGDTWRFEGTAAVRGMGFIHIEKSISADFTMDGPVVVEACGRTVDAYHIHILASRSWAVEKPMWSECWMSEGLGLVRAETANSLMGLVKYEPGPINN